MMSPADARDLSQVASGTAVGDLLRRYWMPIAAVSELEERSIVPVRILAEDLVLYKDGRGNYGLLDRRCPHRQFDLSYGTVEEEGLRCSYHGWKFDHNGRCRAQPYEECHDPGCSFKDRVHIKAYRTGIAGGLIWAYLGPETAPLLPDWAIEAAPGGSANGRRCCFLTSPNTQRKSRRVAPPILKL